jgi:hypothetical protein
MSGSALAIRWWRLLAPGRNLLVRSSDRAESALLTVAILIALAAAPFAGMVGSDTYGRECVRARAEAVTRHPATAVLLADAPQEGIGARGTAIGGTALVQAGWAREDGTTATGTVAAPKGAAAGDRMAIWLDVNDAPVPAPLRTDAAAWTAAVIGLLAWLGVITVCALVCWLAHLGFNRARYLRWEQEWEQEARGRV